MSEIHFNANGQTHSLRIRVVDTKPDEVAVWEALVDATTYCNFEAPEGAEIWELIELASAAWREELSDNEIIKTRWRD